MLAKVANKDTETVISALIKQAKVLPSELYPCRSDYLPIAIPVAVAGKIEAARQAARQLPKAAFSANRSYAFVSR
jgi:hypothetical protein